MIAIVAVDAHRADVTAEGSYVRRPVPLRKLRLRTVESAVEGHAVFHDKRDSAVGASSCGLVGACGYPDFISGTRGIDRSSCRFALAFVHEEPSPEPLCTVFT